MSNHFTFQRVLGVLLGAILAAAVCLAADAAETSIGDVSFRNGGGTLLVDFDVADINSPKLVQTLDSGLPVRFVYHVRLVRKAGVLTSGVLSDAKFERVVEKDNLKSRYRVTENAEATDVGELKAAIEMLGRVRGVATVPVAELIPEKRYQIEIQVKLEEFRLPFHLHRILPFLSAWDVTTPWKTVRLPPEVFKKP